MQERAGGFSRHLRRAAVAVCLSVLGFSIWVHFGSLTSHARPPSAQTGPVFGYRLDGQTAVLGLESYNGRTGRLQETLYFNVRAAAVNTLADCLQSALGDIGVVSHFQRVIRQAPADLASFNFGPEADFRSELDGKLPCFEIAFHRGDGRIEKALQIAPRIPRLTDPDFVASGITRFTPSLPLVVPPEEFTFDQAMGLFEEQLTAEALRALADISFKVHESGCPEPQYEANPVGGCYRPEKRTVYINDDRIPDYYSALDSQDKVVVVKGAMHVLVHESLHALEALGDEDGRDSLTTAIFNCYIQNPEFEIESQRPRQRRTRIIRTPWERIGSATEECLNNHPFWGDIAAALRHTYTEQPVSAGLNLSRWGDEGETFSLQWYMEYYAELPTYDIELPLVLEDHYGRYFKNRRDFAAILNSSDQVF